MAFGALGEPLTCAASLGEQRRFKIFMLVFWGVYFLRISGAGVFGVRGGVTEQAQRD